MLRRRDMVIVGALGAGACGLAGYVVLGRRSPSLCEDDIVCQERRQQADLPHADDPIWPKLRKCRVTLNRQTGDYSLQPTDEMRALVGRSLRVRGFVLPLDGTDETSHFLIGVNTPVCFYHPPGDPNQVMEVVTTTPVAWNDGPVTVTGRLALIENSQMGVFFKLNAARET